MLAIERRNAILEKLQVERRVVVSELSELYEVSEETIRRDLDKLETDGYAIKSYGGAVINENANFDLPFNIRKNRNVLGKQKIADIISQMINDGECIMLDASSTAVAIAKSIKEKNDITVITNSVEIVIELLEVSGFKVISTGGVARSGSCALVGPQTSRTVKSYCVDKTIISAKGLDLQRGFSDTDELLADNKHTMLNAAREKILAVDHTKFNQTAFSKIGDLHNLTTIVTDQKPGEEWLQAFEKAGVKCIYPE